MFGFKLCFAFYFLMWDLYYKYQVPRIRKVAVESGSSNYKGESTIVPTSFKINRCNDVHIHEISVRVISDPLFISDHASFIASASLTCFLRSIQLLYTHYSCRSYYVLPISAHFILCQLFPPIAKLLNSYCLRKPAYY